MHINPLTAIDFYKADHRRQYPEGTTEIYSNFTPRSSNLAPVLKVHYDEKVVFFGLQYFMKDYLVNSWNDNFFKQDKEKVVQYYKNRMDSSLGKDTIDMKHIEALHDLGYLPIRIKALPEGTRSPIGIPLLTIVNTHPDFFWLTNYIESALSCYLWKPITVATIAYEYKKLLAHMSRETGSNHELVDYQAHDFSFRGMSSIMDAAVCGAAHLTSFKGTDNVSAIDFIENYYDETLYRVSVPATEHSVMCMGTEEKEFETFKRLITELYPSGTISIVSDTWDLWRVITEYLPKLKKEIISRRGQVVIRPDSGDPVKIIIGDPNAPIGSPEYKGVVECLWDIFHGTLSHNEYKCLTNSIGVIYGDSITLDRVKQILGGLAKKGFASSNIIFGVGSFTYQYITRDSFGFAVKATSGVINGERRDIFKNPKTDCGIKKSAKGLLKVVKENGKLKLYDCQTPHQEKEGMLKTVFLDGKIMRERPFSRICMRIAGDIG